MANYNENDLNINELNPLDTEDGDKIGEALRETRRVLKTLLSLIMETNGELRDDIIATEHIQDNAVNAQRINDDVAGKALERNTVTKALDLKYNTSFFEVNTSGEITLKTGINLSNFITNLDSASIQALDYGKLTHSDTSAKFLISQANGAFALFPITGALSIDNTGQTVLALTTSQARVVETTGANVSPGGITAGTWTKRSITFEQSDSAGKVSLSGGNFVLTQGSYLLLINVPGYGCGGFQARLRDVDQAVTVEHGTSAYSPPEFQYVSDSDPVETFGQALSTQAVSTIFTSVNVPEGSTKELSVEMRSELSNVTNGLGKPANIGESETWTVIQIFLIQEV